MPFVNIRWVEGRSRARKDEIAKRVTAAISEPAEIPPGDIWVVFKDVAADDWFVGPERVSTLRKRAAKTARRTS
jgi:4-oxalocrotonate tautomerase